MSSEFLNEILRHKKKEVSQRRKERSVSELERTIDFSYQPQSLHLALRNCAYPPVIAEIKKGSPSAGRFPGEPDPATIAQAYQSAGAAAISVLTDEAYFFGSLDDLRSVRKSVSIPILRKDFIVDPYQIAEARAAGADAILLIAAALPAEQLADLYVTARDFDLETLVEVHTAAELERVLTVSPSLIGINNRDLHTFQTNLQSFEVLASQCDGHDGLLIAESGIQGPTDAHRMVRAGAHGLLIGSQFMSSPDPGAALRNFMKEYRKCYM